MEGSKEYELSIRCNIYFTLDSKDDKEEKLKIINKLEDEIDGLAIQIHDVDINEY